MVPYRFDERVSRHLAHLVPNRREEIASYEREALDDLLASGPGALVSAPADVSSLVRTLLTTCSLALRDGSVVELYGIIDFLAANTPPTGYAIPGALLIGDAVLVDVLGRIDPARKGGVFAVRHGDPLDHELYPLANSVADLLGSVRSLVDDHDRYVTSSAAHRSSFIQPVFAPERRIRLKAG
jgi:hypothetical protein